MKERPIKAPLSKITSIGFLNRADGNVNLTPCIDGSMMPTMVKVSSEEFEATERDPEKMKALALQKLNS